MPFPWTDPGKYEVIKYTMEHLDHLSRNVRDTSGVSRQVMFKFSYHCFTDSSQKENDFRHPYDDPAVPEEAGTRVFCPKRWLMSRDLVKWLGEDLSNIRVNKVPNKIVGGEPRYVWNKDVPGMNKPYVVVFRFGKAEKDKRLIIDVETAYVRGSGRMGGETDRFISYLKEICGDDGALAPGKGQKVHA